ncbi:MFS transporter, partial [Streptomyces sp. NPDC056405]
MAQSCPEESAEAHKRPPPLWRDRDYLYWWTGNGLSALGTSMSTLAIPLLVLYLTGSATQAGLITVLHMIGRLATLAIGGVLADRMNRRAILCLAPLVQALSMGVVALLAYRGDPSIAVIGAMALAGGLADGLRNAVSMPVLRRIVPKEQVAAATAQSMGRDMVAQLVGAPLGGLLYAMGRWIPFLVDALSFLFVSLGSALIRRPLGPDRRADDAPRAGLGEELRDGLR